MNSKTRDNGHSVAHGVAQQAIDRADDLAARAKAAGSAAVSKITDTYQAAQTKAVRGARATDRAIRNKPYHSIGIAFGVGLLLGFFIKRKRSD
jgi:ElaB/YqjD/DUF883 family membrane-anchored ribosome-binding protein